MMTMSSLKPANAFSAGTMPTSTRDEERQQRDEVVAERPQAKSAIMPTTMAKASD